MLTIYPPGNNGFQLHLPRVSDAVLVGETELIDGEAATLQVSHGEASSLYEVRRPRIIVSEENSGFEEAGSGQE